MIRPVLSSFALFALVAGLAGACGGDDGGESVTEATTSATDGTSGDDAGTPTTAVSSGGGDVASVDPCTLLTEAEVASAFNATNPQYAVADFTVTSEPFGASFASGTGCEYSWEVANSASGNFQVETLDEDDFELLKTDSGEEIDGVGDEAFLVRGVPYAMVDGVGVGVLGVGTEESATRLLGVAVAKLG